MNNAVQAKSKANLSALFKQVPVNKTGKSKRQEQRPSDSIKLPTLGCYLSRFLFQIQANAPDDQIPDHELTKSTSKILPIFHRIDREEPVAGKRKISGH